MAKRELSARLVRKHELLSKGLIECRTCKEIKSFSFFSMRSAATSGYESQCKICQNKNSGARQRFRLTGFTPEMYAQQLAKQEEVCAICKRTDLNRSLAADHDHLTGQARGLLCKQCNQGVGIFEDNHDYLLAAAAYLIQWQS